MDKDEAKFILRGYRPGGVDADNPVFDEALQEARRDPGLADWFKAEQNFDRAISAKLRSFEPPVELRNAILAGGKVSRTAQRSWNMFRMLGLAAAAVIVVAAGLFLTRPGIAAEGEKLVAWVVEDTERSHPDFEGTAPPRALREVLDHSRAPIASLRLPVSLDEMRRTGCRSVNVAGHQIYEVCFVRDGHVFHLYITARISALPEHPQIVKRGKGVAAVWGDAEHAFALTTEAGAEALRRVL